MGKTYRAIQACLKSSAALLLVAPALAWSDPGADARPQPDPGDPVEQGDTRVDVQEPEDPDQAPPHWADTTHAYVTDQAQSLTEWMDAFFGDPAEDLEAPESLLRLQWINSWDEEDDEKTKLRLRGKLQLPAISKRLDLVFSEEDGDDLGVASEEERDLGDRVGLLYNLGEKDRSRLDLTLGISTSELRPGIRYRNKGPIGDRNRYRFTQRIQYEDDEGFFSTSQLNLDHAVRDDTLLRWSNRGVYGEETQGVEWRSRVSLSRRLRDEEKNRNTVLTAFTSVKGYTDPAYTRNYRIGGLLRSRVWRRYLFVELEPSYNWRKNNEDDDRDGVWNVVFRVEIVFMRDLRHSRTKGSSDE